MKFNIREFKKFREYCDKWPEYSYTEQLHKMGFKSAKFDHDNYATAWHLDDNEYDLFVLKWG